MRDSLFAAVIDMCFYRFYEFERIFIFVRHFIYRLILDHFAFGWQLLPEGRSVYAEERYAVPEMTGRKNLSR
ncbi:MAG: hypothetical protein V8S30_01195 [Merdibacter sp.]